MDNELLIGAKLLITAYSTVGMDYIFLKYLYNLKDGQVIYYTPKQMLNSLKKIIGTTKIPAVRLKLANQFYHKNNLKLPLKKTF